MNNIWVIVIIFVFSIVIAGIINFLLNRQDKKEEKEELEKKKKSLRTTSMILSFTILEESEENSFRKLMENFQKESDKKEFAIGWNEKEEIKTIEFQKNSHFLIVGTTGGGKSICLNEIISSIIMNYSADELKIVTIDTSMVELSTFNGIPHYIKDTIISPNEIAEELEELQTEVKHRQKEDNQTELFIIIDDFYDICSYDSKIITIMENLLEVSREKKVHFILATDTPSSDIITKKIKKQIDGTIYLTLAPGEKKDFELALTKNDIEFLTEIGNAIYKTEDIKEKIKIPEVLEKDMKAIKNCFPKYH